MKRIIVVGASSGIGKEIAIQYATAGNLVAITGRRKELLNEISAAYPGSMFVADFDVTDMQNADKLEQLIEKLGGLDLLVISAGIGLISRELDWAIEKRTVDTNVQAFIQMAQWAFNYFAAHGGGQIANISSVSSWRGNSWAPAYSASKAFQSVYFEGLHMKARRLKLPVIITDIQPGFVDTGKDQGNRKFWVASVEKAADQIIKGIESRRFRFFVTRRWWGIAQLMKWMPGFVYHRVL
jgi:short-subunit dehydrogenase